MNRAIKQCLSINGKRYYISDLLTLYQRGFIFSKKVEGKLISMITNYLSSSITGIELDVSEKLKGEVLDIPLRDITYIGVNKEKVRDISGEIVLIIGDEVIRKGDIVEVTQGSQTYRAKVYELHPPHSIHLDRSTLYNIYIAKCSIIRDGGYMFLDEIKKI